MSKLGVGGHGVADVKRGDCVAVVARTRRVRAGGVAAHDDPVVAFRDLAVDLHDGRPRGPWSGKLVAVCDPPPPTKRGGPVRTANERPGGGNLLAHEALARGAVNGLKACGLPKRIVHVEDRVACVEASDGALRTLAASLRAPVAISHEAALAHAGLGMGASAELVWKPCEATMSMFDPLWLVTHGDNSFFVDERGKLWSALAAKFARLTS